LGGSEGLVLPECVVYPPEGTPMTVLGVSCLMLLLHALSAYLPTPVGKEGAQRGSTVHAGAQQQQQHQSSQSVPVMVILQQQAQA